MTDNNLERIGEKILQELNDEEWKMILTITKEKLSLEKQNEFGLYIMFGDTIKEAWKKAIK